MRRESVSLQNGAETSDQFQENIQQVRDRLGRDGLTVRDLAREIGHQGDESLIYDILGGKRRCLRGKSHVIAVKLGLKTPALRPRAND